MANGVTRRRTAGGILSGSRNLAPEKERRRKERGKDAEKEKVKERTAKKEKRIVKGGEDRDRGKKRPRVDVALRSNSR